MTNINDRLAASIYKQGEAAQAAGETAAAVAHFQRVGEATPTASIVATAEYDAAAGLLSLQQWSQAAAVLDRFRSNYPNDPRQGEVTRRLATAYLSGEQPLQAAREFERIGHSHEDPTLRREALWQAAELYAAQTSRTRPSWHTSITLINFRNRLNRPSRHGNESPRTMQPSTIVPGSSAG